jgi:hypothetical protein
VSFVAVTLYVASQRVFIVVVLFRYGLSPETFGYTLVLRVDGIWYLATLVSIVWIQNFNFFFKITVGGGGYRARSSSHTLQLLREFPAFKYSVSVCSAQLSVTLHLKTFGNPFLMTPNLVHSAFLYTPRRLS